MSRKRSRRKETNGEEVEVAETRTGAGYAEAKNKMENLKKLEAE